jgi:chemotaxis protein methyltransferase CheR
METQDFEFLSGFLKNASGLALTADKAYLLNSRLQPVAHQYGLKSVADVAARLRSCRDERLRQDVIEAMTTNETSFFRDNSPFENFKDYVLPAMLSARKTQRRLRILCAAASSGQEPYSLAMLLTENAVLWAGWNIEIVGVDIDAKILTRAANAVYTQFEVQRGLPVQMLLKHFEQQPGQNWALKPQVKSMVKFRQCNLLAPFHELGTFDVVFCRNVLIYFDRATKSDVLHRLSKQMPDDGFLFLGGAETVIDISNAFCPSPNRRGLYIRRQVNAPHVPLLH